MAMATALLWAAACTPAAPPRTFATFVDGYLEGFAARHPSIAAGNGIHTHDEQLDDFSAAAIAREIDTLKAAQRELAAFDTTSLSADERVDQRILGGIIDGWLLEQETLANWKRNPMPYASALTDGVHNLMTMANLPAPVRMRRIISKLRGVPALITAARANLVNPPRIFAERGLLMFRSASAMLQKDLPLAFAAEQGTPLMDSLTAAAAAASREVDAYVAHLETTVVPNATGDWKTGADAVARRYRGEELISEPLAELAALGERELVATQTAFRRAAEQLAPGTDPLTTWMTIRKNHPKRGEVVAAAQRIVDSLTAFVAAKDLAVMPQGERVQVASAMPFDLGFASMHASPPLENPPVQSFFYITDADSTAAPEAQEAWLERFNYASLAITAAHEAMPGHWLHSIHMRQTPGKVRRIWIGLNPFPQPSSGQDGWAHYAEQLVVEQGYMQGDPRYAMAQASDALTRICRLLSGIRLHAGEWTLAQAQACFEQQAYLAAPAAKREAERGTYDPTYGGYFLGKRGMLTLRRDVQAKEGTAFSLRSFHERVMNNGIAPLWAQRQLLLPGDTARVIQ
jgi:uncharacterized protein (DUF885 family)